MAKRTPYSKPPAVARTIAKARVSPSRPRKSVLPTASRPAPVAEDALPSLADLKRARAKLDAAIAALERKRRR